MAVVTSKNRSTTTTTTAPRTGSKVVTSARLPQATVAPAASPVATPAVVLTPPDVTHVIPGDGTVTTGKIADRAVTDSKVSTDGTLGDYLSASARATAGTPISIWLIGDSNGVGSNGVTTGYVGGWRNGIEQALACKRSDFDFVGSTVTAREGADCGLTWHDCYAGEKVEDATTNLTTRLAGCASTPQIVVECLGTNNLVAGDTAAQLLVKQQAYEAALFAALPNAHLFVTAPPPLIDGSTTHASLTALQATQADYNALLSAHCAADPRLTYVSLSSMAKGEFQLDGVHENRQGQISHGELVATPIDLRMGPAFRMGPPTPRQFRQRHVQYSLLMGANSDGVNCVSGNGYAGGANSMMIALDLYPTALDAALRTIICYGNYSDMGVAGAWMLSQNNGALSVYWNNASGTLGGSGHAMYRGLVVNKWHRLVLVAHLNGGASSLGLYINRRLAGVIGGLPAWNFPAAAINLGKEGVTFSNGQKGYYSRLRAYRGSSIPRPGSKAAQIAVDSDYYDDGPLVSGACIACHDFDGVLTDTVYGGTSFTIVGGTTFAGPYPSGTPLRPWEFAADYL